VFVLAHHEHRAWRQAHNVFRYAPHEHMFQARAAVRGDNDQIVCIEAPNWLANASAYFNASSDGFEKSIGTRTCLSCMPEAVGAKDGEDAATRFARGRIRVRLPSLSFSAAFMRLSLKIGFWFSDVNYDPKG
jgi:hypothetical protein